MKSAKLQRAVLWLAISVWFLGVSGSSAGAQEVPPGSGAPQREELESTPEEPIEVVADQLSVDEGGTVVEARGSVRIQRDKTTFDADTVRINRTTQNLKATGNVAVDDPEYKLKASDLDINLTDETAKVLDAELFIEQNHLSLTGRRLEKFVGQSYEIEEGLFTTCLCESGAPPWRLGAEEIDLRRDGAGVVRAGTFYIFDVPVMYLPYAIFPMNTRRKSGLLFPEFGSSSEDGFLYQQPFFWAINKSNDATFTFTVESRSRVGLLGEYRTVLNQRTQAQIEASYFNESMRGSRNVKDPNLADPGIPVNRWNLFATHRHETPSGWMTYSDIFVYSDNLFTRELSDLFDLDFVTEKTVRTSRFARSQFGVYRNWKDTRLRGEWDFYQDFIQPQSTTLYRTPQILFSGKKALWDTPFQFRWHAQGINYLREDDADGLRLDVRPEVVLPLRLGRYLMWSSSVALRETYYHLYDTGGKFNPAQDDFSGQFARNTSRTLPEVRWSLATSLGRVFDWEGKRLTKIRHVVEPEVSYVFIPSTNQSDIPIWDGVDRINRRNLFTFAVTNRFWGKRALETGEHPREDAVEDPKPMFETSELARWRVALSYDVDKARRGGDSLSDLDTSLRVNFAENFSMDSSLGLDPGRWNVTQAAIEFSLSARESATKRVQEADFNRPNQLSVGYRYIRKNFLSPLAVDANLNLLADCPGNPNCQETDPLNQVRVNALYHLTENILLMYDSNYDGVRGRFTSNRGGVKYLSKCECWTFEVSVNKLINPDRTNVRVGFNFLGLGSQNRRRSEGADFLP